MRTYDISRPPELINIGFDGENKWRPRGFICTDWLQKHPGGIITLWVQPEGVKKAFPVSTTKVQNTIIWYPLSEELYPGTGKLQLTIQDGEFIGKSDTIKFEVNKSLVSGGAHPDSQPSWATKMVDDVTAQADRAVEAADRAEQASGEEVISEAVENYFEEHPVVIEETDPTVPAWAKNPTKPTYTANEVGALPADTPIPAAVTEQDVAGWGFTKNTGTYSKPSGGIPAFDLAPGVIPDVSGKANAADVYTKTEVDQKLVGAMDYKGTKATVSELPTSGNATGDVWHITADGSEWAWNGSTWEELGTAVDLSGYRTASVQDAIDAAQDTAIAAKYSKPDGGIPKTDLASGVIPSVPQMATDPDMSDWTSGKTVDAAVLATGFGVAGRVINAKYTKPNGGIPKTDLAANVQTSLGKADTALQEHQSLSGYATETYVQQQIAAIPDELPAVTATDNGKFLRVVNGAWAVQAVPAAESASFGGGS